MAKILIVDDRALNRKFLLTLLGYSGHQLFEAADGAEALVRVRAEHPDLVITDLLMPTMDGFQLVQQMRSEPAIAATEVIFYTATYRLQEADELAKACGVSVVISKPSDPELILNTVNTVLGKTQAPSSSAALIPAKKEIAGIQLKTTLTDYVLDLKLLNAQMTELVDQGNDLAQREAAVLDGSQRLRQTTVELQAMSLQLASLLELSLELTVHRDPDELLNLFCRAAVSLIGAKYGALGMLGDDDQHLAYFKYHGDSKDEPAGIAPASPYAGILGALLDEARPRRERNPDGDPRAFGFSPAHPPIHDFLGVPVLSSEQVYGWFYLADRLDGQEFGADDEQLASTLAAQLAVVYHAARMYDEVQRHAAKLEIETFRRKQAEEKFHSVVQAAPNGMLMVDSEGKIVLVNAKTIEMFGYAAAELVGQPIDILLPERVHHAHAGHRRQFMRNLQTRSMGAGRDLYGRRKDGTEFSVEIGLNPLTTSEGIRVLASVIDITERKRAEDALRDRMRAAEFSADISGALAGAESLRAMLQKCAEAMVQHLGAAFARIWLLNPRENILELQTSAGLYTHIDGAHGRVPVGRFKIGLIAEERRPHLTNAVVGDPRVGDQEWAKKEGMVSFAGYPLLIENRVLGVMAMFAREPISGATFDMLATIANEVAVGIERKLSEERERQHFERTKALHEINRAITSTLDLQSVLSVVINSVEQFFSSTAAVGMALLNHESGVLEPVAARGMRLDEWKQAFFETSESFINASALKGPLVIADLQTDPHVQPAQRDFIEKYEHASLLVVPIIIDDRLLGLLSLATTMKYEFSHDEIEFFKTFAGQAAVAIQNADLYERTRKQSLELVQQERIQRILKELSQDITKMDVDTLLKKLTSTIGEVFKIDIADVRFLAEGKWSNIMVATENLVQHLPGGAVGPGATDWVIKNRKPIAIDDYLERKEFTRGRVASMFGARGFIAAPLMSKSGEVMGVIRALSKESRKFTAQEIDLFEQLATGAAVAIENEQLYRDLEKSNRIKSEFLGVMSHELRTPLNIILGYSALLEGELVADADRQQHGPSLHKIESQAESLLSMIDTIMEAAQIDSGAIAVTKQQLDIRDSLKQLKAEYESVAKKDLILTWNWPDTLPIVLVDHQKLKRILQHLINNAIKFTETGTVTVSAKLLDPQDARGKPNDRSSEPMDCSSQRLIEFEVSDTGIGIPEESLPIIFDMFKQVDSSNTRSYGGAGLGLYIVKQYTELLGGTIDAKSTEGGGSTFTVRIPCDSLPGHA